MSSYAVNNILSDVRTTIDENKTSTSLVAIDDLDTLTLNDLITNQIVSASVSVIKDAPLWKIGAGDAFAQTIYWRTAIGVGMGWVQLPDDFVRLIAFQMSDWARPVTQMILDTDPRYAQQFSKFAGIKGTTRRPVCALTQNANGAIMEFFSCTAGTNIKIRRARYAAKPKIVDANITLPDKLYTAIVEYTAGLTLYSLNDKNQGDLHIQMAKDQL